MHKPYPIKETVRTIVITKQKQKINFQIRHPENVSHIIAIAVTCDKIGEHVDPAVEDKGNMAGHIVLSLPQKGDVIYSDDVRIDNNDYADIMEKTVWGLQLPIGQAKPRDYFFKTCFPVDKAVLEGFYEDFYSPQLTIDTGEVLHSLYKIRVYIRYQIKGTELTKKL